MHERVYVCECIDHIDVSNPVCVVYMIYSEYVCVCACVCVYVSMCACSVHVNHVWCVVYKLTRCGVNEI